MFVTLSSVCCVCAIILLYKCFTSSKVKLDLPGPRFPSLPIVGQSYLLVGDTFAKIKEMSKRYGPIYRFDVGPLPTVIVTTKELMLEAFRHEDMLGRPYNLMASFEGMMRGKGVNGDLLGFAGSQGQNWKEQRRFFVSEIRHKSGVDIDSIVKEEAEAFVRRIQGFIDKKSVESEDIVEKEKVDEGESGVEIWMHQIFMPATVNVVWRISTGQSLPYDDPKIVDVIEKIYEFFKFLQPGPNSLIQLQYPLVMKLCSHLGIKNGLNTYQSLIEVIQQEVENPQFNKDGEKNKLVANYLKVAEDSSPDSSFYGKMGRANLVATLGDIFMGGADTTNNQLEWILLFVAHHKNWQHKMRQEIFEKFGKSRTPDFVELNQTPSVEAFLLEVWRLRPIAPLALPRLAMQECRLAGKVIAKNTQLLVDLSAILQDPEVFEEPQRFNPSRFLNDLGEIHGREHVSQIFGAGKRRCPGEKIAKNEMFTILVKLLQNFEFNVCDKGGKSSDDPFKGIFGLNHVPEPYSLLVKSLE